MALPVKAFLHAMRFASANPAIRVTLDADTQDVVLPVNTTEDYWTSGDLDTTTGQRCLRERLRTALRSPGGTWATFDVSLSETNIFTVTHPTVAFTMHWGHANTTVEESVYGFADADTATGLSAVAPFQSRGFWTPDVPYTRDTNDVPVIFGTIAASGGNKSRASVYSTHGARRAISYLRLHKTKILTVNALAAEIHSTLEYAWDPLTGRMCVRNIRVYDDRSSRTTTSYRTYRASSAAIPWREKSDDDMLWYEAAFMLRKVVP